MKRRKKLGVQIATVVDEPATEAAPEPVKLTLVAKFKVFNKEEGVKEMLKFESAGGSPEELLEGLQFPRGTNCLVNVTLTRDGVEMTRSLAPHRARLILEYQEKVKALEALRATFRGLL